MTKAYYIQKAQNIFPIYGVCDMEEAKRYIPSEDHGRIVETSDDVYMNIQTGSVDFESNWVSEGADLGELTEVEFNDDQERWIEK